MSHYFTNDQNLKDSKKEIEFYFKGEKFVFSTNAGMFSPDNVDEGTIMLISNLRDISGDILDLGCAYGVVGVSIAATNSDITSVTMSDVNINALEYAKTNAKRNNVSVNTVLSDSFESIDKSFDNIILNPPIHAGKAKMYQMYEESYGHLNAGGKLHIVIRQKHGAQSTKRKLEEIFSEVITVVKQKGVFVFCAVK